MIYSILVPLVMFGWALSGLVLCTWLGVRRGVAAVAVLGWLLLPMANYSVKLLPPYAKDTAVAVAIALAVLVLDSRTIAAFRFRWIDVPMLVFCTSPMATSVVNGFGVYDGYSVVCLRIVSWGFPYFVGRLYFHTIDGIRDLTRWIIIGGMVYVPLCLIEIKMSPQLSNWIYGISPPGWGDTIRFGGWRPVVFTQHGLALGLFMCAAATTVMLIWRRMHADRIAGFPMGLVAGVLVVVAVLTRSTGAITLMFSALAVTTLSRLTRTRIPLMLFLSLAPLYLFTRASGLWSGDALVQMSSLLGEDRSGSLQFRIENENILAAHARLQPILGWGTWSMDQSKEGGGFNPMGATTDGYWIILFGSAGVVGLASWAVAMLLPAWRLINRCSPRMLLERHWAPACALAMLVTMYTIDCLFNAMMNPLYAMAAGALAGLPLGPTKAPRGSGARRGSSTLPTGTAVRGMDVKASRP